MCKPWHNAAGTNCCCCLALVQTISQSRCLPHLKCSAFTDINHGLFYCHATCMPDSPASAAAVAAVGFNEP